MCLSSQMLYAKIKRLLRKSPGILRCVALILEVSGHPLGTQGSREISDACTMLDLFVVTALAASG